MTLTNSKIMNLNTFLTDYEFRVPVYQRAYSWKKPQIDRFFDDLVTVYDTNDPQYFLGQIVVYKHGNGSFDIVDGVQRITTTLIFLDAIRTTLNDVFFNDVSEKTRFLDKLRRYYIKPNHLTYLSGVQDYFSSTILQEDKDFEFCQLTDEMKRIKQAHKWFTTHLKAFIRDLTDPFEVFSNLVLLTEVLLNHFHIIYLETDDFEEAFMIFETLNSKGTPLLMTDMIKSYVYRFSNSYPSLKEDWVFMERHFSNTNAFTAFLITYFETLNQFLTRSQVYEYITKYYKTGEDVYTLVQELNNMLPFYLYTLDPFTCPYHYKETLVKFHYLGISAYKRVYLTLIRFSYTEDEINTLLHALLIIITRSSIFFKNRAKISSDNMKEVINFIYSHQPSLNELLTQLRTFLGSDALLIERVLKENFTTKQAFFVLHTIISFSFEEVSLPFDPKLLQVEHIIPQKLSKSWSYITQEQHDTYVNRLGNLTLIHATKNKGMSNKSFDEKKAYYKLSDIPMTYALSSYQTFTISDVYDRSKALAHQIKDIWTF